MIGRLKRSQKLSTQAVAAVLLVQVVLWACVEGGTGGARRERESHFPSTQLLTGVDTLLQGSANGVIAYNSAVDGGIVLLDPTTGRKEFLTKGSSPEWSTDGRELTFMRDGRIYVVGANGTNEREIPVEPFLFEASYMVRPVLSPSRDRVAYGRQGEIELANVRGGKPVFLLTPGPANDQMPAWSPRGRQLAFVRDQDIHVVGADGSGLRNLTRDPALDLDPSWSPTGDRIAFSSRGDGPARIWTIRADGSNRRRVTSDVHSEDHHEYHPSWSPDGSEIVFERWDERQGPQNADLYIVSLASGMTRPLVVTPGFDGLPSWGPGSAAGAPGARPRFGGLPRP